MNIGSVIIDWSSGAIFESNANSVKVISLGPWLVTLLLLISCRSDLIKLRLGLDKCFRAFNEQ